MGSREPRTRTTPRTVPPLRRSALSGRFSAGPLFSGISCRTRSAGPSPDGSECFGSPDSSVPFSRDGGQRSARPRMKRKDKPTSARLAAPASESFLVSDIRGLLPDERSWQSTPFHKYGVVFLSRQYWLFGLRESIRLRRFA